MYVRTKHHHGGSSHLSRCVCVQVELLHKDLTGQWFSSHCSMVQCSKPTLEQGRGHNSAYRLCHTVHSQLAHQGRYIQHFQSKQLDILRTNINTVVIMILSIATCIKSNNIHNIIVLLDNSSLSSLNPWHLQDSYTQRPEIWQHPISQHWLHSVGQTTNLEGKCHATKRAIESHNTLENVSNRDHLCSNLISKDRRVALLSTCINYSTLLSIYSTYRSLLKSWKHPSTAYVMPMSTERSFFYPSYSAIRW